MFVRIKSIAHGAAAMRYAFGQTKKKDESKVKLICTRNIAGNPIDRKAIWEDISFGLSQMSGKKVKNNMFRIEISPSDEELAAIGDDVDAWQKLIDAYIHELDQTAELSLSKCAAVWTMHLDTGRAHAHGLVCRIDEQGRVQSDKNIGRCASMARDRVCRTMGWKTEAQKTLEGRTPKKGSLADRGKEDCFAALRDMAEWSWQGYKEQLAIRGWVVRERTDKSGVIKGYTLGRRKKYKTRAKEDDYDIVKASLMSRQLMVSQLAATWKEVRAAEVAKQAAQQSAEASAAKAAAGIQQRPQAEQKRRTNAAASNTAQPKAKPIPQSAQPKAKPIPQSAQTKAKPIPQPTQTPPATAPAAVAMPEHPVTKAPAVAPAAQAVSGWDAWAWRDGLLAYPVEIGGEKHTVGLTPAEAQVLDDCATRYCDKEDSNGNVLEYEEFVSNAIGLFVGVPAIAVLMDVQVGLGEGGAITSDMPWGRRDDEDEMEAARRMSRCCLIAAQRTPRKRKRGQGLGV